MSTLTLVAYHNDQQIKSEILAQLARHRAADDLVQGHYGYWRDGKGGAVGCTIHSGNHIEYETRFGIPVATAKLEDDIFEGLSLEDARAWPERLMSSIRPGQDLLRVHWALLHWLLTDETINPGINHPTVRDAVQQCADMVSILKSGGAVSAESAWNAMSGAAASRKSPMRTKSAEYAAFSAGSAASAAAWSAERAERAVTRSAECVANAVRSVAAGAHSERRSAWLRISDKLIELIEAAPMAMAEDA